jgi:hypothetical protein
VEKIDKSSSGGWVLFLEGFVDLLGILGDLPLPGVGVLKTACSTVAERLIGVEENLDYAVKLGVLICDATDEVMSVLLAESPAGLDIVDQRLGVLAEKIDQAVTVVEDMCKKKKRILFTRQRRDEAELDCSRYELEQAIGALNRAVGIENRAVGIETHAGVARVEAGVARTETGGSRIEAGVAQAVAGVGLLLQRQKEPNHEPEPNPELLLDFDLWMQDRSDRFVGRVDVFAHIDA